jgi:signal transduction histidine kinase
MFVITKEVGESSGLGLSIVHGIVKRHGGQLDVDSKPGQGTTFTIAFPRPRSWTGRGILQMECRFLTHIPQKGDTT